MKKITPNQIKVISLAVGILALILILSGQSFAIFSGTILDENSQIVKVGSFEVVLNQTSNTINTSLDALSDVEGLLQTTTYNFTVENIGDSNAKYKVLIIDDETLTNSFQGQLLDKSKIRVGLEVNDKELGPLTLSELNNVLNEKKLNKGKKDTYKLRLWLDSSSNTEEIKTQKIFLKLKLEAEQYFTKLTAVRELMDKVGESGLEKVTHEVKESDNLQVESGTITEYRFRGGNDVVTNNYVSFNGEEYRIIGIVPTDDGTGKVENRIKIIKSTSLGNMYWDESDSNNWARPSTLNTYLNNDYYNTLSSEAKSMIAPTKYYLGGSGTASITTDVMWQYERKKDESDGGNYFYGSNPNSYTGNIAIMYVSDYGYAATGCDNSNIGGSTTDIRTCKDNNWLYLGSTEWFLPQSPAFSRSALCVFSSGYVDGGSVSSQLYDVRPVLSLKADTPFVSGDGSKDNPYKLIEINNLDTSKANAPDLLSNMIPVYYDETCNDNAGCWEKADSTNSNETYKWYNYDEKMWANAVTVSSTNRDTYIAAPEGTEIPMNDINAMFVWIPRYTYTYLNTNTPQEIKIQFEEGTNSSGTITCTDNVSGSGTTSQTCTDRNTTTLVAGTSTYTHPAFSFGDKELTGFWMGKFENSTNGTIPTSASTAEHTLIIKPNVNSLIYKAVSYQFKDARQMEKYDNIYGFEQANQTTFNLDGTLTNDSNNLDTHMLKNIEWGAVTYLSHSKYGINKEIAINSANTKTTGCGPQTTTSTDAGATCNAYSTPLGQSASTTGNVYGVYDMSGGVYEYVMGNMVNSSNQFYPSSAGQWSATTKPLNKYYDSYTYDASSKTTYTRGKLGDATKEMAPTQASGGNWYSDYAHFVYSTYSWFQRGGSFGDGAEAGAFSFYRNRGGAYGSSGSRSALCVLD